MRGAMMAAMVNTAYRVPKATSASFFSTKVVSRDCTVLKLRTRKHETTQKTPRARRHVSRPCARHRPTPGPTPPPTSSSRPRALAEPHDGRRATSGPCTGGECGNRGRCRRPGCGAALTAFRAPSTPPALSPHEHREKTARQQVNLADKRLGGRHGGGVEAFKNQPKGRKGCCWWGVATDFSLIQSQFNFPNSTSVCSSPAVHHFTLRQAVSTPPRSPIPQFQCRQTV